MGVYARYDDEGNVVLQPDSYKNGNDTKLTQLLSRLIRESIAYEEAQGRGAKPDSLEKAMVATVTKPDGSVSALSKADAIQLLEKSANDWTDRAMSPGLDGDLKQWLLQKADLAKDEIRRLNGENVPERAVAKAVKPVVMTLPK